MWREKYIRWQYVIIALNALVSLLQIWFTYEHIVKHEYWLMLVSIFFFVFNGWFAWRGYKQLREMKAELKAEVWRTLSTPSEALR